MEAIHIEQRYWRHQFLAFISSLLVLLSLIPLVFLFASVPDDVENPRLDESGVFYLAIATAFLLAAFVLSRISIRRLSYREMRDPKNQERLHDEHERSIRYRAGFRSLQSVVVLQGILFFTSFGLPSLPPGLPQLATLFVAHLVFWVPYLQQTK